MIQCHTLAKKIWRRAVGVGRIAGYAGVYADLMAQKLTERWRESLGGEVEYLDVHQLQLCVRDDLHKLRTEIHQIESEHLGELSADRFGRKVRDVAIPQLRTPLLGIQRLFEGAFGPGSSEVVFKEVLVIPYDPFPLKRVGHIAHDELMDPELVLPALRLEGITVVPGDLAKSFDGPLRKLDQALAGLEETLPATSGTLSRKIRKLAELQQQVAIGARFLEALYYLAGEGEIAQRIRLSAHGSSAAAANDDQSAANDDQSAANDDQSAANDERIANQATGVETGGAVATVVANDSEQDAEVTTLGAA